MISDKGLYGMASGVITTGILQPFQNIKMALMIPPKDLQLNKNFLQNGYLASQYIQRVDGIKGFYKGFIAATTKAALGCYIFFGSLRYFQIEDQSATRNFISSSLARIVSTIVTNPLNVIQTRFQLADFHQYKSIHGAIHNIYKKQGIGAFFSGCLASCIKQGFFAGMYYMQYQQLKYLGLNKILAGILSGMLSTAITHPFELIRARLQTIGLKQKHQISQHLIFKQLKDLRRSGEWMKGLAPRLIKKPIANTLTFYIFQVMQQFKGRIKQ